MPILSGLPTKTKYTPSDNVFVLIDGVILQKEILEWRVVVDNPEATAEGRQTTVYKFADGLEVDSTLCFSSKNHLLGHAKGGYFNKAIMSGSGGSDFVLKIGRTATGAVDFGSWADLAHFDFINANFIGAGHETLPPDDVTWATAELIVDGANFEVASLPESIDTKAEFMTAVKSYDAETTIWTDGDPIGMP